MRNGSYLSCVQLNLVFIRGTILASTLSEQCILEESMDRLKRLKNYSLRMYNRLAHGEHATDLTTHYKTEYRRITWTIENADKCPLDPGECLESPTFSTGFTNITKWCLRLYPKGRNKSNSKVGLFLFKITPSTKIGLEVKLFEKRFALSDNRHYVNEQWKMYTKSEEIGRNNIDWGSICAVLEIVCEMKVSYMDEDEDSTGQISEPNSINCNCTLSSDFKELYDTGKFTDAVLQIGKRQFHVHKAVLSARSPVFSAMFEHTMKECKTDTIVIDDVEPCIVDDILHHIYTGKADNITVDKAILLYPVSAKCKFIKLQNECLRTMLQNLTVENVCRVAVLADIYFDTKLKDATNNYFRNYYLDIFGKGPWKALVQDRPLLAPEILNSIASNMKTKC